MTSRRRSGQRDSRVRLCCSWGFLADVDVFLSEAEHAVDELRELYVSVGRDHDTPAFAVASIRHCWSTMGVGAYPDSEELFITADAGGSNGYRSRAWKAELQKFADDPRLRIRVPHFPPGTSKWNKMEHRLFCHITQNWRGKPLRTFEAVVQLIGHTRTKACLRVKSKLRTRKYPTGLVTTNAGMDKLALHKHAFRGEWNYAPHPRPA